MKIVKQDYNEGVGHIEMMREEQAEVMFGQCKELPHYHRVTSRIPNMEKIVNWVNPDTFKEERRMCSQYVINVINTKTNFIQVQEVWVPLGANPEMLLEQEADYQDDIVAQIREELNLIDADDLDSMNIGLQMDVERLEDVSEVSTTFARLTR